MNTASVIAAINAALCKGTRILAFEYHGKTRNVLVGAKWMQAPVRWGHKINRALIQHNGETYLHAQVHNESGSPKIAKIFNVKDIQNLRGGEGVKPYNGGRRTRILAQRPDRKKRKYSSPKYACGYTPCGTTITESMARIRIKEIPDESA